MVLGDFFRNLFSDRDQASIDEKNRDVGITGLPRYLTFSIFANIT